MHFLEPLSKVAATFREKMDLKISFSGVFSKTDMSLLDSRPFAEFSGRGVLGLLRTPLQGLRAPPPNPPSSLALAMLAVLN